MIKHLARHSLFFTLILLFNQNLFAVAELLVKTGSVAITGHSSISTDLLTIYGGISGSPCTTVSAASTCNSCIDTSGSVNACNQSSVHPALKLSISFQVTKTVTGVAKLFIDTTTELATLPSAAYTADSSTITLETTWGAICSSAGLTSSCVGATALLASKVIGFGVDSDNTGQVEDAERSTRTIKLHYIPAVVIPAVTQTFCPTTAVGSGVCNIKFIPGDAKVFIDTAIYGGVDADATTGAGLDWDAIAVFPISVLTGGEAAAYTSFRNGVVAPIFKTINSTDGSIPDSQVSGGIENYQKYCMVYGMRNKAQNIYRYVTDAAAVPTGCVTPSEVVGVLGDQHCFISTAAFGSTSAPEVEVFRKFRNKFLQNNFLGKVFIKFYYKISPPIASFISGNNYLKTATQIMLYPLLVFAFISLKVGFFLTLLLMLVATLFLVKTASYFNSKRAFWVLFVVLLVTPLVKAEVSASEKTINHPLAQEGLVRIKKDGTYIYDTERPLKKESSRISFGQANHPEVSISIEQTDASGNPTGTFNDYNFQDFYNEDSGVIIGYDYEWFHLSDKGRLGLQAGFSIMSVSGNGKLVATPNPTSTESFTFVTLPLTLGGVYRLEWKDKQMFAPYVAGGGTYVVLAEKREDKALPNVIGSLGFYATGGVLINIGAIDRDMSFQLDSEYGISSLWLTLEFRVVEVNSEAFGFSNKYVNAGLAFDF
ncbi:MAG: CFI-box-CTERM domain-containing protein [Bdellovibrionota bacterium]